MIFDGGYKAQHGRRLKTLTSKQMLQTNALLMIKNSAKTLTMKFLENILDSPSFLVEDLFKASKSSYLFNQ